MASENDWLSASRAAAMLEVKRATLYAYVSRGLVRSRAIPGTRERLYHREDILSLKVRHDARAGHAPVAASALRWGEPVLDSSITQIGEDGPIYRGRSAVSLVEDRASFEQAAELLWTGKMPPRNHGWGHGLLEPPWKLLLQLTQRNARPIDAMLLTLTELGIHGMLDPHPDSKLRAEWAGSIILVLSASVGLPFGLKRYQKARMTPGIARRALFALGGSDTSHALSLMNAALVLCADHELNASTFACRVATSAGADLPKALAAGLCTISGTQHGGMTERVEALVAEVGAPERAARVIGDRMRRGEAVPGFGHPLYKKGDPRCPPLLARARALGSRHPSFLTLMAIVDAMELAGAEPPTVDMGLVAMCSALELSRGAPLAIFALGRLAGFVAHADEQRVQGTLLRPRARFVART
jgi:citrate synthase